MLFLSASRFLSFSRRWYYVHFFIIFRASADSSHIYQFHYAFSFSFSFRLCASLLRAFSVMLVFGFIRLLQDILLLICCGASIATPMMPFAAEAAAFERSEVLRRFAAMRFAADRCFFSRCCSLLLAFMFFLLLLLVLRSCIFSELHFLLFSFYIGRDLIIFFFWE